MRNKKIALFIAVAIAFVGICTLSSCSDQYFQEGFRQGWKSQTGSDPW